MANYKIVDADKLDKDLTDIANSIRAKNGTEETYKSFEMAGAIDAIEAGGAYEDLWNAVTSNGTRGAYLFYQSTVDEDLLSKVDLSHVTSAISMFNSATISGDINLTLHDATSCENMFVGAKSNGEINITALSATTCKSMFETAIAKRIIVNAPLATTFQAAFAGGHGGIVEYIEVNAPNATNLSNFMKDFNAFKDVGPKCDVILDVPNVTNLSAAFSNCRTVRSIHFASSTDKVTVWGSIGASSLKSLTGDLQFITGVGSGTFNSLNLVTFTPTVIACDFPITSATKLSLESAKNIIRALVDYSGTEYEYVYTVSLSSTTQALLESDGATAPNGKTWLEYAYDKGWNI